MPQAGIERSASGEENLRVEPDVDGRCSEGDFAPSIAELTRRE